jgi:hypothetical protein
LSGLTVIDIDVKGASDGYAFFDELKNRLHFSADTPMALTPSGGLHLYYLAAGPKITHAKLCPGVDLKGNQGEAGGYVLAPPSVTEAGQYTWLPGSSPFEIPLLPYPDALFEKTLICDRAQFRRVSHGRGGGGLVNFVARAQPGETHNSLYWAAAKLAETGQVELAGDLVAAYVSTGHTESEGSRVVRDGIRRGSS